MSFLNIKEIDKIVNIEWCRSMMKKHNISNKELYETLGINKGSLSKKLNPNSERPLKSNKSKREIYMGIMEIIEKKC